MSFVRAILLSLFPFDTLLLHVPESNRAGSLLVPDRFVFQTLFHFLFLPAAVG